MSSIPSIEIRLAESDDAAAIAFLLAEAFAEYRSLYTPDGYAATAISRAEVVRRIEEGPVWVALSGEPILGTVSVVPKKGSLYVRGMAVLSTARGRRIGELLLAQVERFAASKGIRRLFLSTTPFLDRAIWLYENRGFQRIDEGPNDLFGTPLFRWKNLSRDRMQANRFDLLSVFSRRVSVFSTPLR